MAISVILYSHLNKKIMVEVRLNAHNLGKDLRGKRDRVTEVCYKHAAGSDGEADSLDGLKCEHLAGNKEF